MSQLDVVATVCGVIYWLYIGLYSEDLVYHEEVLEPLQGSCSVFSLLHQILNDINIFCIYEKYKHLFSEITSSFIAYISELLSNVMAILPVISYRLLISGPTH